MLPTSVNPSSPSSTLAPTSILPETVPYTYAVALKIQKTDFKQPLLVLLDSGSQLSWFHQNALPRGICPSKTARLQGTTMAGSFSSDRQVHLEHVQLPEFKRNILLVDLHARIFNAPCRYDMILGRDVLKHFRLNLDFDKHQIVGPHATQPMRPLPDQLPSSDLALSLELERFDSYLLDKDSAHNDEDYDPSPSSDPEITSSDTQIKRNSAVSLWRIRHRHCRQQLHPPLCRPTQPPPDHPQ